MAEYVPQLYVVEGDPNMLHKLSDYTDAGVRRVADRRIFKTWR